MEEKLVKDAGLLQKVCNVLDILGISDFFTSDKSDKSIADSIRKYLQPEIDMNSLQHCDCGCLFSAERDTRFLRDYCDADYLYATECENCDIIFCNKNCSPKFKRCFCCEKLLCPKCKTGGNCSVCDRPLCLTCSEYPSEYYTCKNKKCKDYICCDPCASFQCREHCLKCVKESISCSNKKCVYKDHIFICSICDIHKECGKAFCDLCMYQHDNQNCKICQKSCHYPFCSKECVEIEYQRSLEKLA